ncbi:response regulator UvrY [Oxalicibacterium flavum]|uniref:Response regulator UvrY n=1 Tax=Oxalicibacterium flavum TaxID=179467 RepID=A0A8J2UPX9_9BURK|nr:response regulator transcription factor [Oxalicibacterium flavum]GGC14419.1 response regulator UvrY [Oxalicibacterium flavum]
MQVSILIVEHFPVVRAGIRRWLSAFPDFDIVGETSSAEEGLQMTAALQPDLLLLDLVALRRYGYEQLPAFRSRKPLLPVIILHGGPDHFHTLEMMGSNASGHFPSDGTADELVSAIRTVCNGQRYPERAMPAARGEDRQSAARHQSLTARELQVFHSMCRGERPTETAHRLSLSLSTVNRYRKLVFRKMEVDGMPGLIRYAVDQGIEVFPE